jgi:hypothetical protein
VKQAIVVILSCDKEFIYCHKRSIQEALNHKDFNSRNRAAITIMTGSRPHYPQPSFHPEQIANRYVFLFAVGPNPSDVRAFEGDKAFVSCAIPSEHSWHICDRPKSRTEVDCPEVVRAVWLRIKYASKTGSLLDDTYYLTQMSAYSIWSYDLHYAQAKQVASVLPPGSTLVVPGDGIGVFASFKQHKLILGDFVKNEMTHRFVRRETFMQTMVRGRSSPGENKVLVLSYVVNLMSPSDIEYVNLWDGPLVVIDSKDTAPFPGLQHIGPGVYARDVEIEDMVPEKNTAHSAILYSENLLSFESISYKEENPSVVYFKTMRPLANYDKGQLIAHSLPEYIRLGVGTPSYLTSIGRLLCHKEGQKKNFTSCPFLIHETST